MQQLSEWWLLQHNPKTAKYDKENIKPN